MRSKLTLLYFSKAGFERKEAVTESVKVKHLLFLLHNALQKIFLVIYQGTTELSDSGNSSVRV